MITQKPQLLRNTIIALIYTLILELLLISLASNKLKENGVISIISVIAFFGFIIIFNQSDLGKYK